MSEDLLPAWAVMRMQVGFQGDGVTEVDLLDVIEVLWDTGEVRARVFELRDPESNDDVFFYCQETLVQPRSSANDAKRDRRHAGSSPERLRQFRSSRVGFEWASAVLSRDRGFDEDGTTEHDLRWVEEVFWNEQEARARALALGAGDANDGTVFYCEDTLVQPRPLLTS